MPKQISLQLLPQEAADDAAIRRHLTGALGCTPSSLNGFLITRKSIDARGRQVRINLTLHRLPEILEGPGLGELIDALAAEDQVKRLAAMDA